MQTNKETSGIFPCPRALLALREVNPGILQRGQTENGEATFTCWDRPTVRQRRFQQINNGTTWTL